MSRSKLKLSVLSIPLFETPHTHPSLYAVKALEDFHRQQLLCKGFETSNILRQILRSVLKQKLVIKKTMDDTAKGGLTQF